MFGELQVDVERGVIWFNTGFKCKLRICGLSERQVNSLVDDMLDITVRSNSKLETHDVSDLVRRRDELDRQIKDLLSGGR